MLQFLQPAGLLALGALALPALLHLWRRPTQTVRLGSLRFLKNLPQRRLRHLRWRERMLLAVRLSLLTMLALLLAQPHWRSGPSLAPKRLALLDPNAVLTGSALDRWRALVKAGYETRRLASGFPSVESGAAPFPPAGAADDAETLNLWSLLREADSVLPVGSAVAVFSPGRMTSLQGQRPTMRHGAMEWTQTTDRSGASARAWIESLESVPPSPGKDRFVRVRMRVSDASADRSVQWLQEEKPGSMAVPGHPDWKMELTKQADGTFAARLLSQTAGPLTPITSETGWQVKIGFDPDRAEDARHLQAAVAAVREADGGHPIQIESGDARQMAERFLAAPPERQSNRARGFLFWLSDKPLPAELSRRLAEREINILCDASPAPDAVDTPTGSVFAVPPDAPGAAIFAAPIRLWRRASADETDAGATLWRDGFGQPLLTFAPRKNGGGEWHFHSRFHPDWNDLPRTGALPAWMHQLLLGRNDLSELNPAHNLRLADPEQAKPAENLIVGHSDLASQMTLPRKDTDLQTVFWFIAVALFGVERVLSGRRSTARNGAGSTLFSPTAPQEVTHP